MATQHKEKKLTYPQRHRYTTWMQEQDFEKIKKIAETRSEYSATLALAGTHETDPSLVKVTFMFSGCGKLQFLDRLTRLLIEAFK